MRKNTSSFARQGMFAFDTHQSLVERTFQLLVNSDEAVVSNMNQLLNKPVEESDYDSDDYDRFGVCYDFAYEPNESWEHEDRILVEAFFRLCSTRPELAVIFIEPFNLSSLERLCHQYTIYKAREQLIVISPSSFLPLLQEALLISHGEFSHFMGHYFENGHVGVLPLFTDEGLIRDAVNTLIVERQEIAFEFFKDLLTKNASKFSYVNYALEDIDLRQSYYKSTVSEAVSRLSNKYKDLLNLMPSMTGSRAVLRSH